MPLPVYLQSVFNLFTFIAQHSALFSQSLGTDETVPATTRYSEALPLVSRLAACVCAAVAMAGGAHTSILLPPPRCASRLPPRRSAPVPASLPTPSRRTRRPAGGARSSPVGNGEKLPVQSESRQTVLLPTTHKPRHLSSTFSRRGVGCWSAGFFRPPFQHRPAKPLLQDPGRSRDRAAVTASPTRAAPTRASICPRSQTG